MINLNRLNSGKELIKQLISTNLQPQNQLSKKRQEEKISSLRNKFARKSRPTK